MSKVLVGYTGFVGSNLVESFNFDGLYNSKNISEAFNSNPDLLVYSGVTAQKFIANSNPDADFLTIKNAIENIKKINPKKLVLISTIDVYDNPIMVDEDFISDKNIEAYGRNRFFLENWVKENVDDYLIVRLPGLFGKNIKKNFIYDLIHIIPNMLKKEKFEELIKENSLIKKFYHLESNGFYKCMELSKDEEIELKNVFLQLGFTALNFTDSRAIYQFYNLKNLWKDINIALENNLKVVNLATEPICVGELYNFIYNRDFVNEFAEKIVEYNFKTKYDYLFSGSNGYIVDKKKLLCEIRDFVLSNLNDGKLKLAISNIAWGKENDLEMYNYLKNKDISYLEAAPTRLIENNPYENIEMLNKISNDLLKEYNLKIVSLQSIWYGKKENIFESDENYKNMFDYTKKVIDFANTINCENIVFGCPKNRNMSNYDVDYIKAIDFFRNLGNYAKNKNVIISLEPNPRIYNTNFLNNTEEVVKFVKDVGCDAIKINYDLGTVIENKESLDTLFSNIKLINHIHISEPNLVKIQPRDILKELIIELKKLNYQNFISIEMKQSNINDVKETVEYIKDLIGE